MPGPPTPPLVPQAAAPLTPPADSYYHWDSDSDNVDASDDELSEAPGTSLLFSDDEGYLDAASDAEELNSDSDAGEGEDVDATPLEAPPVIHEDPQSLEPANLFDPDKEGNAFLDDFEFRSLPRVFDDHPSIRHAYIQVFLAATFDGMTHHSASASLKAHRTILRAAARTSGAEPDYPGLDNFAITLPTVEKRLGVSTEGFVSYYALCSSCWAVHDPHSLRDLPSPQCPEPSCDGLIFRSKRLSSGKERRTPVLVLPFVPPSRAIRCMCLQPGKVAQWQDWRRQSDVVGRRPPLAQPKDGYDAFDDMDKPMEGLTDGWVWRTVQAGLERRRTGKWDVKDVDVRQVRQMFVALPNGLIFQMNMDW